MLDSINRIIEINSDYEITLIFYKGRHLAPMITLLSHSMVQFYQTFYAELHQKAWLYKWCYEFTII